MTSKIVEVIAKILEGLSTKSTIEEVGNALLKSKQYDAKILSTAFSLIYDKILLKNNSAAKVINKTKGIRILSEDELDLLGVENYNYILHLTNVGLIDPNNLESIIGQLTLFPELKVTKKEINWIILLSLVEYDSELLPGSRFLLYTSDTVN